MRDFVCRQTRFDSSSIEMDNNVRKYFSEIGSKGGKKSSRAKLAAVNQNLKKAWRARKAKAAARRADQKKNG